MLRDEKDDLPLPDLGHASSSWIFFFMDIGRFKTLGGEGGTQANPGRSRIHRLHRRDYWHPYARPRLHGAEAGARWFDPVSRRIWQGELLTEK